MNNDCFSNCHDLVVRKQLNKSSLPPSPDDVFCNGEGAGGERTHRDTEEGEAEEQAAKVYAFLARESSDFCRARPSVT